MDSAATKGTARARWGLLKQALAPSLSASVPADQVSSVSVRRHNGYQLLNPRVVSSASSDSTLTVSIDSSYLGDESKTIGLSFIIPGSGPSRVHHSVARESGVDNTGNVCVWPSEHVLADFCLKRRAALTGRICELGAGMTGLAAVALAAASKSQRILVTDGNPLAAEALRKNVEANRAVLQSPIDVSTLRWDRNMSEHHELKGCFDAIILSDCLFFEDFHIDLYHVIDTLLSDSGTAYHIGPKRGKSTDRFRVLVQDNSHSRSRPLVAELTIDFDASITELHRSYLADPLYSEDIHRPILLTLSRANSVRPVSASDCIPTNSNYES